MAQHIEIPEILDNCEIKLGYTKNERRYFFQGKLILRHSTRTKNVWLQNAFKEFSSLSEKEIEKQVKEHLLVKKALFCDTTDIDKKMTDGFASIMDNLPKEMFTTNLEETLKTIGGHFPEGIVNSIKEISEEKFGGLK